MKSFIAITTRIKENKLILISVSNGLSLYNENGLTFDAIIDFLFSLKQFKTKDVIFCSYASSLDNEFIFSSLPKETKDKLFQSNDFKKQLNPLRNEQEQLKEIFYNHKTTEDIKEQVDFDLYVNKLALKDLHEIKYNDYTIKLINGKYLTITKNHSSITIYDIYGFFKKPLDETFLKWFDKELNYSANVKDKTQKENLKLNALIEAKAISKLGENLSCKLQEQGINLKHFHGASSVSSWLLSKSDAKKEYYNYNHLTSLPCELSKAMLQAFHSPRAEQFKIGTLNNVNVYDINSAYAFAILDLPVMLRKPVFTRLYQTTPFSFWYCEFDFTSLSDELYFGLLPVRDIKTNQSRWQLKGKGYYWQPEIEFILKHYPQCINIKYGYYLPNAEKAEFTKAINEFYNLRLQLQAENNPLEKIIKSALQSVFGKFCQHNGKGFYINYFYAGYILSKTRAMLLEATKGYEKETICFLTDAIHTTANLEKNVTLSSEIGAYKKTEAKKATYLDCGVYRIQDISIVGLGRQAQRAEKLATKGFKSLDFDLMLSQLNEQSFFEAEQKLFISHNLHEISPVTFKDYLSFTVFNRKESILKENRFQMREWNEKKVDLSKEFIDSRVIEGYKTESGKYKINEYKENDIVLDSLIANKII